MITNQKAHSIALLRMFVDFNLKTWWRSIKGSELAVGIFFGLVIMLLFAQVIQFGIIILRAETISAIREIYPWFDDNVLLSVHLLLINSMLLLQFFFTKISRLQLTENRKLLGLGMPFRYLNRYLNLAGFLHPINLLFHLFWLIYLTRLASSTLQLLMVLIYVPLIYGIYMCIKWWFRSLFEKLSGWISAAGYIFLFGVYLLFVFGIMGMDLFGDNPQELFNTLVGWLLYTPAYPLYLLFAGGYSIALTTLLLLIMLVAFTLVSLELQRQTTITLKTPLASGNPGSAKSFFPWFKKLFGHEGGKSQYYIWNQSYARMQMATALFFPALFLIVVGTSADDSLMVLVSLFLALVPAMALVLMMTNLYGFENRELLLSIQFPVSLSDMLKQKIYAAVKVAGTFLFIALLALAYFVHDPVNYVQQSAAILFIFFFYLNYKITGAFKHYKKIEKVSLYALSSPIIPQSVNFFIFFTIILFGLLLFPVFETIQWLHISLIIAGAGYLLFSILRKLGKLDRSFRKQLIPKLWNEL